MSNLIYVYFETGSNLFLTKGITPQDFAAGVGKLPKHILFLDRDAEGTLEQHTGFSQLTFADEIKQFLTQSETVTVPWVDYDDLTLVEQLTPVEVSELLYLAHAKTHLKSPFYYKLQNDFVCLPLVEDFTKVYYRHLHQFLQVFSKAIDRSVQNVFNQGRFFKKKIETPAFSEDVVSELRSLFIEGCAFNFEQAITEEDKISFPIYLGDKYLSVERWAQNEQNFTGYLILNRKENSWELSLIE